MLRVVLPLVAGALLSGCAGFEMPFGQKATPEPTPAPEPAAVVAPDPDIVEAPPPAEGANTAEALDTTTPEQRAAAAAPAPAGARVLGTTIVSLGSPTEPGFWLKTPLVSAETAGKVTHPGTGKSATVTLIPLGGEASAGSRMSLPAMRLIGASLTELTEVEVSVEGS